jgi:phosphatidylserine decarboxylase
MILLVSGITVIVLLALIFGFIRINTVKYSLSVLVIIFYLLILWFFRVPTREFVKDDKLVYAPADGKIVVIEKTIENEYFKDERVQISIFMSPLNVHANYYPISGKINYMKYHPGKYLVAWHPKSSLKNERSTVVIENEHGLQVLVRQIAGILARRIICNARLDKNVEQGEELGFIRFGSRVDIFLPVDSKILVKLNQSSRAKKTVLAEIK